MFKTEPITVINIILVSVFMILFGFALLHQSPGVYHYQVEVMSLDNWGKLFIGSGVIKLVRLFLQKYIILSGIIHGIVLGTLIIWTSTWLRQLGESATALPPAIVYSFVTLSCIMLPYITPIINKYHRQR